MRNITQYDNYTEKMEDGTLIQVEGYWDEDGWHETSVMIGKLLKIIASLVLCAAILLYVAGFIDILSVEFKRLGLKILTIGIFLLLGGITFDRIGSIQKSY